MKDGVEEGLSGVVEGFGGYALRYAGELYVIT